MCHTHSVNSACAHYLCIPYCTVGEADVGTRAASVVYAQLHHEIVSHDRILLAGELGHRP